MVTKIYKGDSTNANGRTILINLPDQDFDGLSIVFEFLGKKFVDEAPERGGAVRCDFTAEETARMPLGTHFARLGIVRNGIEYTASATIPICVSDSVGDVYGGDVANINLETRLCAGIPDLADIDHAPQTSNALAAAFRALLNKLQSGVCMSIALVCAACAGADPATAPMGEIPFTQQIVTNQTEAFAPMAHLDDRQNPHGVTAEQIGAVTPAQAERIAIGSFNSANFEISVKNISPNDYNQIANKPKINGRTIEGSLNSAELGVLPVESNGDRSSVYFGAAQEALLTVASMGGSVDIKADENGVSIQKGGVEVATVDDVAQAVASAGNTQEIAADVAALSSTVAAWEGYWGGSNVCFEVTNYYGNTSGEIPKLRIKELITEGEGAPFYKEVWNDISKFEIFESNLTARIENEVAGYVATNAAPLAWGAVTDKGAPNPVQNSVWMTSPQTVFAGGTEYQRVAVGTGAICVLTARGAEAYTAGEAGTFRFQDDGGTNYFGFAKTDSYTIGCNTDGIQVENGLVTLTYNVIMAAGEYPVIYYRESLAPGGEWVQLNALDGSPADGAPYAVTFGTAGGSVLAFLNVGDAPSGFFKAETAVAGDVVFETNMKLRLDGGVLCTDGQTIIYPHADGTWRTSK